MAKATPVNILIDSVDSSLPERVTTILEQEHGVHGIYLLGRTVVSDEVALAPDFVVVQSETQSIFTMTYKSRGGENISEESLDDDMSVRQVLSRFAVSNLYIPLHDQTSRADFDALSVYSGERPNLEADPSTWIVANPFIANLCRRFPEYGNLVRYLCNEKGLFLKVGNYPNQRAYWNSTTNGGLPVNKKSDPTHEGTFMLHDMFHFVPTDPLIGTDSLESHHKATYIAHRLLSEASTLVLADMVAVADAGLGDQGYDVSKRRIFPVYESITKSRGTRPDIDKLLAANAYFCFTGDPEGFKMLGASESAVASYKTKYEAIFRDDFMWNLHNLEAMIDEKTTNPRIAEYYKWLEEQTSFPRLVEYDQIIEPDAQGINIPRMLSLFRADYKKALSYQKPIDDVQHAKVAIQKYLAGQRIVFSRFGDALNPDTSLSVFDANYVKIVEANDSTSLNNLLSTGNQIVDNYIQALNDKGCLLPHEVALCRFSIPLYPVKFVNYERKKQGVSTQLAEQMNKFININRKQLNRLLEAVAS